MFLEGILKNPVIIRSLIQIAIATDNSESADIFLRFFINLTFVVNNPAQITMFMDGFNLIVLCYLGQKDLLLSVMGKILLLRLINNLIASDIKFTESLYN